MAQTRYGAHIFSEDYAAYPADKFASKSFIAVIAIAIGQEHL